MYVFLGLHFFFVFNHVPSRSGPVAYLIGFFLSGIAWRLLSPGRGDGRNIL